MPTKKESFKNRLNDESGIYFVLTALLTITVLGFLIGLGLDTSIARHARQELNLKVDVICKQAALNLPIHSAVFAAGQYDILDRISNIELKFAEIEGYRIILGTMPENSISGELFDPEGACYNGAVPYSCSGDCGFVYDVCDSEHFFDPTVPGSDPNGYPLSFWNAVNDSGIMIACEASARVNRFFTLWDMDDAVVSTRSVWWRSLRGGDTVFTRHALGGEGPAFIVAIAPQMQTDSSNPLYTFEAGVYGDGQPGSIRFDYNPLLRDDVLYLGPQQAVVSPFGTLSSLTPLSGNDQEDMLVASLNPPLLVRNVFTSTIIELLSRGGETRNRTELLVLNSRHMAAPPEAINLPVRIVGFGDDLTDDRYQPPYLVHFNSGWRNPYDSLAVDYQDTALFTGQLRFPFHFFNPAPDAIKRYDSGFNANSYYEHFRYGFRDALKASEYDPLSDQFWDMRCAWGTEQDGCSTIPDESRLTAAEVVHMLGSAQVCPSPQFGCTRPGSWKDDLKPDLLALWAYVGDGVPALNPPGLFSFTGGVHTPGGNVEAYSHTEDPIVLLVLHDITEDDLEGLQNFASGQLHVVYIPSRPEAYEAVCDIQARIGLDCEGGEDPPPGSNSFILIGVPADGEDPPTAAEMRAYWAELLGDGEDSVRQKAINYYNHVLTTVRRRL